MNASGVVKRFLELFGSRARATYRDGRVACAVIGRRRYLECAVNRRGTVRLRVGIVYDPPDAELIVTARGRVCDIDGDRHWCAMLVWVYESVCGTSRAFASDSDVNALRGGAWNAETVLALLDGTTAYPPAESPNPRGG